jgi:mannose/fructose/N-acetylgalactosamine-specific phosphotransferase system component IIC
MQMFDPHTVLAVLGIAVAGGIIGLDRTAVGQFMISQPIVAGPFTGWLLGDPTAGIVIGASMELVWLLDMPIGTFVPADATIGTVSAAAAAALGSPGGASLQIIGISMLMTTAIVPVTMQADGFIRTWNSRLADRVLSAPAKDRARALTRAQLTGLTLFFLKSFILYCMFIPLGIAAIGLFGHLPDAFHRASALFVMLLPLVGVALVVRKLSMRTLDQYLLIGFASAVVFGQVVHAPALVIVLLTATAGWLGARYNERRA